MRTQLRNLTRFLCIAPVLTFALTAQTIHMSPGYTTVGVNGTVQYTATVTGLTNTSVTWSVNSVTGGSATYGRISTGGLYTAPSTIPANGITITALASDHKTSVTEYVAVEPVGPSISSISPNPVPTGSYTVTLTGTGFQKGAIARTPGVNLSTTFVNSTTLTASGYHGAPGTTTFQVTNPGTLWGPAFSVTFAASGPPPPQTISPTSAIVKLGATQQFTSSGATAWTATAGAISTSGLFTAPASMPSSSSVTVTATGPGGSASATVTLQVLNPQTIAPATVSLNLGATQQFTSAGATSFAAAYGTVTGTGFYTAPSTLSSTGTDTVTATGPNGTATATVTLIPPSPVITSVGSNGQLPLGIFTTTIAGTGFTSSSVAMLNGVALGTTFASGALTATGFASVSGAGNIAVRNGSVSSPPFPVQIGVPNAQVSSAAARRFLEQAAFGPTPADAANVQTLGYAAWLTQQFNMAQVSNYNTITSDQGGMPQHFLTNAVSNPGSVAPARGLRAQPDLCDLHSEADLEPEHGSVPEHAAGRCVLELPPDHGGRHAQPRHGPISRHGQQRHGRSRHRRGRQ